MTRKTYEEYIETIYALEKRHGIAKTTHIATDLGLSAPSVTEMLHKLQEDGFVNHVPYQGTTLTPKGEKLASELMQKHRTLAEFLKLVGVSRENAELDACKIEHNVSQETIAVLRYFTEFVRTLPSAWWEEFRKKSKKR